MRGASRKGRLIAGGAAFRAGRLPWQGETKAEPRSDKHFYETDMYHPEIFSFTDRYLEGHWACEKYYHDILPLLREKIRFPEERNPEKCQTAERMEQENSVSVHIRRGDYLDPENAGMFGGICTDAYYETAMN